MLTAENVMRALEEAQACLESGREQFLAMGLGSPEALGEALRLSRSIYDQRAAEGIKESLHPSDPKLVALKRTKPMV